MQVMGQAWLVGLSLSLLATNNSCFMASSRRKHPVDTGTEGGCLLLWKKEQNESRSCMHFPPSDPDHGRIYLQWGKRISICPVITNCFSHKTWLVRFIKRQTTWESLRRSTICQFLWHPGVSFHDVVHNIKDISCKCIVDPVSTQFSGLPLLQTLGTFNFSSPIFEIWGGYALVLIHKMFHKKKVLGDKVLLALDTAWWSFSCCSWT